MTHARRLFGAILIATSLLGGSSVASEFRVFARRDQVAASDLIVVGRVLSVESAWTANQASIETRSVLVIDKVWKGVPSADRVTVVTLGGRVGGIEARVDAEAELAVGERVLLFLRQRGDAFAPVGMRFGKYQIVGEGGDEAVVGNLPPAVEAAQRFEQVSLRLGDVRAEVADLVGRGRP